MKYSWNAKTPMTFPDMVAKPIKWNPMSEDWKKRVEAMQLYNEDATAPWLTNEMKKTLRALRDRILTFGGDEVLLNTRDEDSTKRYASFASLSTMPKPSMKHRTSKRFSAVLLLPRILS